MLKKILGFYTKYFAVWVVIFGIVAYLKPGAFIKSEEQMTWFFAATIERLLPQALRFGKGMDWFFALTMFGIGAVLQIEDFKRIAERPVIVIIGSAAQFTIMPLGAFLLAKIFRLSPAMTVGLIITGSAPGAMASNVMSYIAKADTAYSVSLTTVSTLLCPLLTPGLTFLLVSSTLKVSFLGMVLYAFRMIVAPLFVGFGVRHLLKEKIEKILPIFPAISATFIIFICSCVIASNKEKLTAITSIILILTVGIILNVYGMLAGYGVGSVFRMNIQRRRTLAIEIGMQNAGFGMLLAKDNFGPEEAIPAAIFVFICIITASAMSAIWQKIPAKSSTN